jgi:hypothetical protein
MQYIQPFGGRIEKLEGGQSPQFEQIRGCRSFDMDSSTQPCYRIAAPTMKEQRWLRIIPVALIMYTISYIDRTNVALAFDPKLSTAMADLGMDDKIKEQSEAAADPFKQ